MDLFWTLMDRLLFIFIRILYQVLIVLIVKIPALDGSRPSIVLSPPMVFLPLAHRPPVRTDHS